MLPVGWSICGFFLNPPLVPFSFSCQRTPPDLINCQTQPRHMNNLVFLDDLRLERQSPVSLGEQLRSELRAAILDGRLHAGSRMPSSRALAQSLIIARNVVIAVYEDMIAEGYFETRPGVGTFVNDVVKQSASCTPVADCFPGARRAQALLHDAKGWLQSDASRILEPGIPALDLFPMKRWSRCFTTAFSRFGCAALNCEDPQGIIELRQMIAGHIGPSRGVACSADQIVIVSSLRQALHVLFHYFLDEGEPVLIENPCLPEIPVIAKIQKVEAVPLPVSAEGADITAVGSMGAAARLAVVTASHQYPLGVQMGPANKAALLNWATQTGGYIIEDDYDGEFWMTSDAPKSLYSQADDGRVIYVNSFSKTLFPSLRISYMVVPEAMAQQIAHLKAIYDPHPSALAQFTLAEFIGSGAYSAHLREMRTAYRERNGLLRHALQDTMRARMEISAGQYGLHLCAALAPEFDDTEVAAQMQAQNFGVKALSSYYIAPPQSRANGIVMGYAGWAGPALREVVAALDKVCR